MPDIGVVCRGVTSRGVTDRGVMCRGVADRGVADRGVADRGVRCRGVRRARRNLFRFGLRIFRRRRALAPVSTSTTSKGTNGSTSGTEGSEAGNWSTTSSPPRGVSDLATGAVSTARIPPPSTRSPRDAGLQR
jgi:hypothetical protein